MSEQIPELWWCPSLNRILARHPDDDERLVWVVQGHSESLRHYLGTGLDSNPPMPDDAVRLVAAPSAASVEHDAEAAPDGWYPQVETFLEPSIAANVLASYIAYTVGHPTLEALYRDLTGHLVENLAKQDYALVALQARAEREAKHDGQ